MNTLKNNVQLIGNLGADPEVFIFENGDKKTTLSLATNEKYKNRAGQDVEETQWHNVVLFGKPADIAERFLQKGSEVAITGRLHHKTYEDKKGQVRHISEVIGRSMQMMGRSRA